MRSASTLAPIALLAGIFACAPPAPPAAAPPAASYVAPPLAPTIAPPPLARWVETGAFNDIGPKTKEGTAIVLGGRRGLITPDGTLRVPATPTPEPIEELIEVPTASGARLIGRGVRTLYSFTDILAEPKVLAHSSTRYVDIDPGPGLIAAWSAESERPTFFDVDSGNATHFGVLPALPLRSLSFLDAKKGAAIFAFAGLATTTDGGATWSPIVDADGGAFTAKHLTPRDGFIEARVDDDGSERQVDPVASTLSDPTPHPTPGADASAIERWLARTHRDPLEVAVSDGIAMSSGNALVASQGLVAKVDLMTGSILELVDLGDQFAAHTCSIARGGGKAWVACAVDSTTTATRVVARLSSLSLGDGPLEATPLQSIGTSTDLRWSQSGGVLMIGPCQPGGDGNACVLQPDGKWRTLDVPRESASLSDANAGGGYYGYYGYGGYGAAGQAPVAYGVGPLGDGGVAYLTNFHDDTPPDEDGGAAPASSYGGYNNPFSPPPAPKLQLVVIEGGGMHRRLPPLDLTDVKAAQFSLVGKLEEDADHTLRILFQDAEGPMLVVQPASGAPTITRIEGAKSARIHGAHGIAVGAASFLSSSDAGATWTELTTPAHILATTPTSPVYGLAGAAFEASDVGFHVVGHLRIGWGELDPSDATLTAPTPDVPPSTQPSTPPPNRLVCTTSGTSDAIGIGASAADLEKVFGVTAIPVGIRRAGGRMSNLPSATTLLEIEGPEKAMAPTKWRLHWINTLELGARPHVWTGDAPKGSGWYANVAGAASSGDRAFAIIQSNSRAWALRATSGGSGELVEVAPGNGYATATAIGAHPGDPVAWLDSATLFALPAAGGHPVALASYDAPERTALTLGVPVKGGVPLYVAGVDWGAFRTFSVPPSTKTSAASTTAPVVPATLDGWIQSPLVQRDVMATPPCDSRSRGLDFRFGGVNVPLEIDGMRGHPSGGATLARISPTSICALGVGESVYVSGGATSVGGRGPINFIRADLISKRAEGAESGSPPHVRSFTCKLVPD